MDYNLVTNKFKGKKSIFLIGLFLVFVQIFIFTGQNVYAKTRLYKAVDGIIDLGMWEEETDKAIELSGQWEFYWKELLDPVQLENQYGQNYKGQYIKVPSSWNSFIFEGKPVGGDGYATYKLTILVPEATELKALRLPSIYTAHKLWVNGELVNEDGQVGKSKEGSKAGHYRKLIPLEAKDGQIQIVLQVSNYMHRMGGIWSPIIFGDYDYIIRAYDRSIAVDILVFGVLLSLAIIYIAFYLIRKNEKTTLYFGVFCLAFSLRAILVGNILIVKFSQDISQETVLRSLYVRIVVV